MRTRILGASALLAGKTILSAHDYKEVLASCKPSDLIYMDPPYQGVCGTQDHRYAPSMDHHDFCGELARLNRRNVMFLVSYDGRTGEKTFGECLPESLGLIHLEIRAGRSSQATLLGSKAVTYESLYLSPALAWAINHEGSCLSTLSS
jgi:DNA adenine methylase